MRAGHGERKTPPDPTTDPLPRLWRIEFWIHQSKIGEVVPPRAESRMIRLDDTHTDAAR